MVMRLRGRVSPVNDDADGSEFELTVKNCSWVNAHECQQIRQTHCDLTSDLGSDSNYNVHVRARCGLELSAWTELHPPFNRRNTLLTVPEMTVSVVGNTLHVSFDRLPHTSFINVTMWRRGHELKSVVHMIPAEEKTRVFNVQEEGVYCVRAQTVLRPALQSDSTNTQCVSFTAPDVRWKKPTTVTVTVLIMAALLSTVFWSISHRCPAACQRYFYKEPLPDALKQTDVNIKIMMSRKEEEELCEQIHMMQSVDPELHTSNTGFTSHLED
ncbi:hypothetical protein INR49_009333 [Caranx melampygus]|nr:hypothetical protein INR49_009333 [Caranx melampygus]